MKLVRVSVQVMDEQAGSGKAYRKNGATFEVVDIPVYRKRDGSVILLVKDESEIAPTLAVKIFGIKEFEYTIESIADITDAVPLVVAQQNI